MKNRNGFVSNSSSSSFIVHYSKKELGQDNEEIIYLDQYSVKVLEGYGFVKTDAYGPEQYSVVGKFDPNAEYQPFVNYGYDVTVNQDDVIYFLLKNNIAFHASCHYGDEDVYYVKDSEFFYQIQNIGRQAESLLKYLPLLRCRSHNGKEDCFDKINKHFEKNEDWFAKINVKAWLAENKAWLEDEDKLG